MYTREIATRDTEWFVALGADYDCDGISRYACAVTTDHMETARAEWGNSGTADGFVEIVTLAEAALECGVDTRALLARTDFQSQNWRYQDLGTDWEPWIEDDSIGIPALDSRYDEPIINDDDLEMR